MKHVIKLEVTLPENVDPIDFVHDMLEAYRNVPRAPGAQVHAIIVEEPKE